MLLIRGYYFLFAAFVYALVGICEVLHWLMNPQLNWKILPRFNFKTGVFSTLRFYLQKAHF